MIAPNDQLRVYDSIEDLISNPENPTPMVRVNEGINPHPGFPIYLKLERYNPFGSVKDRIALSMLEHTGIKKGQSLIEPSSGNTGIALAALANARGIPVEIAVPDRIPEEKKKLLRLLGVELWEADDGLCPLFPNEGARGLVKSIAESPRNEGSYVYPNQYENELNVQAHYETTGPEIWRQTRVKVDYFFAAFGTCGTITGVGKYLKEKKPDIKVIGIEPEKAEHNLPGMKRITGLRDDLVPKILDMSLIDEVISVSDEDAYRTGMMLARKGGILVGPTTGAILFAALQCAKERKGLAVAIAPDDIYKYINTYIKFIDGHTLE
ncbi:MAG: cysteine synthase family protein [Methanopyri archaeon]|nr:cysteine synthase family protein [Methanopyri archaeon]